MGGYLAGAALVPGLLLGAVTLLVSGPGVGAYVFDGSPLQPGKEAPRPRGFREQEAIPPASRVAVPTSVSALAAAHAHDGALGLGEIVAGAVKLANAQGHKSRAALLRRVGQVGPIAFREAVFTRALLEVAGRHVEGNVTQTDLEEVAAGVVQPLRAEGLLLTPPAFPDLEPSVGEPWVIVVCDSRGVLAALHATHDPQGLELPAVELTAPRFGIPVRRGVPKVRPGTRLTMPSPVALLREGDLPWCAVAFESTAPLALESLAMSRDDGLTFDQRLRTYLHGERTRARMAIAVLRGSGIRAAVRSLQLTLDSME